MNKSISIENLEEDLEDNMRKKLCLIYNTAPRYREAIFRAIDTEYDCDWYFGYTRTDIKEMDTS